MVVARKIAYNVLVSSVSKILSTALALVSIGLVTRYLGKDGFGNYATVLAFLSFFSAIADLGLNSLSTREISREKADESGIMSSIFTLRLFVSFAVFIISPIVVYFFPYPEGVKKGIVIIAFSFLFSSSYQILNGVFQKHLAMDRVAVAEFLGKIVQVAFIFAAIKLNLSFVWIVSSLLCHMIVSFFIVFILARKYVRIQLRMDFSHWKKFLRESYPVGIAAIITFVYFKIDTILLSVMKSSADVGIYNVAYKVMENITFFPAMIVGLVFPIMSSRIFSHRQEFCDIANKTYKVFLLAVVPLVIGVLFMAEEIVAIIGGQGFPESANILRILVFALAFIFFGNLNNSILIAGNFQKKMMSVLAAAAMINITANLVLIPRFSYFGAASVSVITEFMVSFITGYLVYRNVKYRPQVEKVVGIAFSGAGMALFLFVFDRLNFFVLGMGSLLIYIFLIWLFRAVKTEEITSIISKKGVNENVS